MNPTPHLDDWRQKTIRALSGYGRKAALARHLTRLYGGDPRGWQARIQDALRRNAPHGELLLAIEAWLSANPE